MTPKPMVKNPMLMPMCNFSATDTTIYSLSVSADLFSYLMASASETEKKIRGYTAQYSAVGLVEYCAWCHQPFSPNKRRPHTCDYCGGPKEIQERKNITEKFAS